MTDSSVSTEEKILQAATREFLEKGRQGARMAEIARKAGINKALLHYYFRSKDRLYLEVFRRQIHRFFEDIFDALPQTADIQEFTRQLIALYIEKLYHNKQIIQFIIWELGRGGQELQPLFREALGKKQRHRLEFLQNKFRQAMERGEIAQCNVQHLLLTLIGASLYPFIARKLIGGIFPEIEVFSPEFVERRKEEVFRIIWYGLNPRN